MPDLLEIDERTYRSYIAYEALHKKPVEKAYKRMKRVMPNIDYFDFQHWYFRFLSGNLNLSHDRSKDSKTPLFSDMPIEVVDIIVGKVDAASKTVNEYDSSDSDEDSPKRKLRKWAKSKTIVEEDHFEVALSNLSSFLMNPNWKFKKLTIDFGSEQGAQWTEEEELIMALDSLLSKFQIHVENLTVKSATLLPMVTFLPYFKSDVFKALGFSSDVMDRDLLEKIIETDCWKNAEKLKFKKIPDWFDIQHLFHARKFTVDDCRIEEERLVKIRDILLNSKTFEMCSLKWDVELDINEFHNLHDTVDRVLRDPPAYNYDMDEYFSESTGKAYKITAGLSQYFVELKIEHVVSKL